jgi:hypothetical protein
MWFKIADLVPSDWNPTGPAKLDYRACVGKPHKKPFPRYILGKKLSGRAVIKQRETYIRYARFSTAFGYLLKGDVVDVLWHMNGYRLVRVVRSNTTPKGTVGVVIVSSLRPQK